MDIFTFSEFLNVSVAFFSNIREVRICQPCRSKGNLTITASYCNMVTASKVDFFVYWPNVGSANSGRPEIPRACQTRRRNLDVSIVVAGNSNVIAINEVQRAVFRNSLGIGPIDLSSPADILQRIVHRIASDDVSIILFNLSTRIDIYTVNDVSICLVMRRVDSSMGSIRQFNASFLKLCDVDSIRIYSTGCQIGNLTGLLCYRSPILVNSSSCAYRNSS